MAETTTTGDARDFLVPDLGEGLEEATIVEWWVAPGDRVALNEVLCTVETAKAEVDIPSPFAGSVVTLGGANGETLRVGSLLARIAVDGPAREPTLVGYGHDESIDRSRRQRAGPQAVDVVEVAEQAPAPATPTPAPPTPATPSPATPSPVLSPSAGGRPLASPPVRKLAKDLGVELAAISPGSGPGGIVTRSDVVAASDRAGEGAAATPAAGAPAPAAGVTLIPVTGVRARVAEHMTSSRARIPDATCSVVVDCTRLLEVRATLNAAAERRGLGTPVTPFALLCRLLVQAIGSAPVLNSTYDEDGPAIRVHEAIHLGIGTATDRGLLVTVVRDARSRSTLDLATEIARLALAARDHTIAPSDLVGSTITVSNFGALGLDEGIPVINHPEAAILGVGTIKARPHVVDGQVVARPTASITLAFDHRVADGADAGRLLTTLRDLIETPELALLDT